MLVDAFRRPREIIFFFLLLAARKCEEKKERTPFWIRRLFDGADKGRWWRGNGGLPANLR